MLEFNICFSQCFIENFKGTKPKTVVLAPYIKVF